MTSDIISRTGMVIVLCLIQSLVLNNIHIFGIATPLLYIYMVVGFQRNYPRWAILVWCFLLGVVIDTFSNTPGLTSASLLVIGIIQPYFLQLFLQQDAPDDLRPGIITLGIAKYVFYVLVLTLIYCIVFFTIETFSFFNWLLWIECIVGSALLTIILILTIESTKRK